MVDANSVVNGSSAAPLVNGGVLTAPSEFAIPQPHASQAGTVTIQQMQMAAQINGAT